MTTFQIGIDCELGQPRPNYWFRRVIENTGIREEDFVEPSKFFGAWTWVLLTGHGREERFLAARAEIEKRLAELYKAGAIRGGVILPSVDTLVAIDGKKR